MVEGRTVAGRGPAGDARDVRPTAGSRSVLGHSFIARKLDGWWTDAGRPVSWRAATTGVLAPRARTVMPVSAHSFDADADATLRGDAKWWPVGARVIPSHFGSWSTNAHGPRPRGDHGDWTRWSEPRANRWMALRRLESLREGRTSTGGTALGLGSCAFLGFVSAARLM